MSTIHTSKFSQKLKNLSPPPSHNYARPTIRQQLLQSESPVSSFFLILLLLATTYSSKNLTAYMIIEMILSYLPKTQSFQSQT